MTKKSLIVDISHHQPSSKINWAQAAKEVAMFIIRVQYGSRTLDREYKKHVANCKKHNIPFGHYAYARFVSVNDAIAEANDFLKRADKDAKFLVVDVEEQTTKNINDMLPATQAFVDILKSAGWKVGLYTGHHTYKPFKMDKVKADFLWIPRYGKNDGIPTVKPDYPCDIWQYTEKGRVGWYGSFLDLNQLNSSKSLEWYLGSVEKPPAPIVENKNEETLEWDGMLFRKGQIGRVSIIKRINLWSDDENGKLKMVRVLEPGERFRVYGYRDKHEGQYDLGDGCWVTKMDGYIKYETPSKSLLTQAKDFYK